MTLRLDGASVGLGNGMAEGAEEVGWLEEVGDADGELDGKCEGVAVVGDADGKPDGKLDGAAELVGKDVGDESQNYRMCSLEISWSMGNAMNTAAWCNVTSMSDEFTPDK